MREPELAAVAMINRNHLLVLSGEERFHDRAAGARQLIPGDGFPRERGVFGFRVLPVTDKALKPLKGRFGARRSLRKPFCPWCWAGLHLPM